MHVAKDQYFAGFEAKLPSLQSRADVTTNASFCIRNISKTNSKPAEKNTGLCSSIQLKTACKISGAFAEKKKNTQDRHLAWFCTQPFNCYRSGVLLHLLREIPIYCMLIHSRNHDFSKSLRLKTMKYSLITFPFFYFRCYCLAAAAVSILS